MTTADKRKELLQMAIKADVAVDRWDNIKYTLESGRQIRLNFKKNVIRVERRAGNTWSRINSLNIGKIDLKKWVVELENLYNHQNNIRS